MRREEILHDPEFVSHLHRARTNLRLARALLKHRWEWSEKDRKRFESYISCEFSVPTDELILALELVLGGEMEDALSILKVGEREKKILEILPREDEDAEVDFAVLTFEGERFTDELAELLGVELWNLHEIVEYMEFINGLSRAERSELHSRMAHLHPYVRRAIFESPVSPVVIDGSNIIHEGTGFVNVKRLNEVFGFLASRRRLLFPYRIVFDANVRHVVPSQQSDMLERWLSSPWVEEYSPADERIIELARRLKAVVLSDDAFSEYDTSGIELLKFGRGKR